MSVAGVLFLSFVVLLILNVPIALCLGLSSIIAMIITGLPMDMFPMTMYSSIGKFTLLAIPFFILAGNTMADSGLSTKLINFANAFVGHKRGGLIRVAVVATCIFAAISGSGPATVAALGPILIPAMVEAGYNRGMSTALMASAGAVDLLIPPSIPFVIYAVIAGVSIGKIFMAGFIPGIIMAIGLMLAADWSSRDYNIKIGKKHTGKEKWNVFLDSIWALLMPIIILGGIYGGFFTPTEAAAVAAAYGMIVGLFVYKTLKIKDIYKILVDSAMSSAVVLFVVSCASFFAWFCSTQGISEMASQLILSASGNKYTFLIMMNIILLVVGCFIDAVSALYIFTPIFLPVALHFGYDPIALGVVMVFNRGIGLITPPVGVDLFVACRIGNITLKEIAQHIMPYIIVCIVMLIVLTYIPQVITFLPELFGM